MALEIDTSVLSRAVLCPDHMACLVQPEMMCPVESEVAGNGVFVSERWRLGCPYAATSDGGKICTCPVRMEMWKRFGL